MDPCTVLRSSVLPGSGAASEAGAGAGAVDPGPACGAHGGRADGGRAQRPGRPGARRPRQRGAAPGQGRRRQRQQRQAQRRLICGRDVALSCQYHTLRPVGLFNQCVGPFGSGPPRCSRSRITAVLRQVHCLPDKQARIARRLRTFHSHIPKLHNAPTVERVGALCTHAQSPWSIQRTERERAGKKTEK